MNSPPQCGRNTYLPQRGRLCILELCMMDCRNSGYKDETFASIPIRKKPWVDPGLCDCLVQQGAIAGRATSTLTLTERTGPTLYML